MNIQEKNMAGYTATPVACEGAGAGIEKVTGVFGQEHRLTNRPTNQPTDQPTYGRTKQGIESRARD